MVYLGCSSTETKINLDDVFLDLLSSMRQLAGQFPVKIDLKQVAKERDGLDCLILWFYGGLWLKKAIRNPAKSLKEPAFLASLAVTKPRFPEPSTV
jgi:hypothetical protein